MPILGVIVISAILLPISFVVIKISLKKDLPAEYYAKFPKYPATVLHSRGPHDPDSGIQHWTVEFVDENGNVNYAIEDRITYGSFSCKYKRPEFGMTTDVFVWKDPKSGPDEWSRNDRYYIDGVPVTYQFHFADESLYEMYRHEHKKSAIRYLIFGIILIAVDVFASIMMFRTY